MNDITINKVHEEMDVLNQIVEISEQEEWFSCNCGYTDNWDNYCNYYAEKQIK